MSSPELFFQSINPLAPRTLLLLHGAISSHREWDLVSAHLPTYHLLIPDLPSHGRSASASIPLELASTAALLKDLISEHAQNGKADVVGMSMGGYTAIYIAQKYPNIVGDLFVSGVGQKWPAAGTWMCSTYSSIMFLSSWTLTNIPKSAFNWLSEKGGLKVSDELYADMHNGASIELGRKVMEYLAESGEENWRVRCEGVKARTCVVAGVLDDSEKECRERGKQLRVGNTENRAFKLEMKRHAWSMQDPELFATGINAWMEHNELPEGFIALE